MKTVHQAFNYNDLSGLNKIVKKSQEDEAVALKQVAKQFESMFVKMMLKSMRDASAVFEEDGLFNSYESRFYRQMFDDQMSLSLSQGQGIGLADSLYRDLARQLDVEKNDNQAPNLKSLRRYTGVVARPLNPSQNNSNDINQEIETINLALSEGIKSDNIVNLPNRDLGYKQRLNQRADLNVNHQLSKETNDKLAVSGLNNITPTQLHKTTGRNTEANVSNSDKSHNVTALQPVNKKGTFRSPEDFVSELWPTAQVIGQKMGVNPKAIMAQAALETGWGQYIIHNESGVNSHNLFGIKADSRWSGASAKVATLEYRDGIAKKEVAPFRAYSSYSHSMEDYANFILNSSRYEEAVKNGASIQSYSEALQKNGYATDPQYAKKIQRIAGGEMLNQAIGKAGRG